MEISDSIFLVLVSDVKKGYLCSKSFEMSIFPGKTKDKTNGTNT